MKLNDVLYHTEPQKRLLAKVEDYYMLPHRLSWYELKLGHHQFAGKAQLYRLSSEESVLRTKHGTHFKLPEGYALRFTAQSPEEGIDYNIIAPIRNNTFTIGELHHGPTNLVTHHTVST